MEKALKIILRILRMAIALPVIFIGAFVFLIVVFFAMLIPISKWISQGIEEWNDLI